MLKFVRFSMIGAALALAGCGDDKGSGTGATGPTGPTAPTSDPSTETDPGTSDASASSTGVPNPTSTTNPAGTTDGTTAVDPVTTAGPTTEGTTTGNFIVMTDGGGGGIKECDIWAQDCPPGQKCMPWADDGGSSWNATKCSEIDANPGLEGDPCTVEGSAVAGQDSCGAGLLCWYFDQDNNGTCIDMCTGSPDAPVCDGGQTCDITNNGVLILCLDTCDPLIQSCPDGQICFFGLNDFICDFDASGDMGMYGDPCAYINVCDYGLFCATPESVPGCDNGDGCCSPYCDLTEPNNCPGKDGGQECVPWFEEGMAPPGQENVGACAVPA